MWKLIEKSSMIGDMIIGQFISQDPEGSEQYEIKSIHLNGYITAIHANSKTEIKFFHSEDLIKGKWWIKEENHKEAR